MQAHTPAMQQYYDLKSQYEDTILFFRMGDFYEMFGDDAQIAHTVLGISITSRNKNAEAPIALAGIPFHALDKYLPSLVRAGYKVAIAEQTSDPSLKGIVQREVVRVVTPATVALEGEGYESQDANFIVCVTKEGEMYGISTLETSTNEWKTGQFTDLVGLSNEIYKLYPKEIILSKNLFEHTQLQSILQKKFSLNVYYFDITKRPRKTLLDHFSTKNLHGFGIEDKAACVTASATMLEYLSHHQKSKLDHLQSLSFTSFDGYLELDEATIKNLDLLYNFATNSQKEGTLLGVLDQTKTAMGKRLIRKNIVRPYADQVSIEKRHDMITELIKDRVLLRDLQKHLGKISDIDAIITRLSIGRAVPKDLLNLKESLKSLCDAIALIEKSKNSVLKDIFKS